MIIIIDIDEKIYKETKKLGHIPYECVGEVAKSIINGEEVQLMPLSNITPLNTAQ